LGLPLFLKPGTGHATRARQRAAVSVRHLHTPGRSYTLIRRVALDRVGTCHVNEYVTHFLKFTGHPSAGTRRHNGLFACFYIAFMNVYSQQSVRHYTKCDDHYTKCDDHYTNMFHCRTSRSEGKFTLSLHEHLIVRYSVRLSTFPAIITRTSYSASFCSIQHISCYHYTNIYCCDTTRSDLHYAKSVAQRVAATSGVGERGEPCSCRVRTVSTAPRLRHTLIRRVASVCVHDLPVNEYVTHLASFAHAPWSASNATMDFSRVSTVRLVHWFRNSCSITMRSVTSCNDSSAGAAVI